MPGTHPGTSWVIKQNSNDPRWWWAHWSEPLATGHRRAWNSSADFDRNSQFEATSRRRIEAARIGDRIWAWQTDEAAFLGVLYVRSTRPEDGGVTLVLQRAAVFDPPISRSEVYSFPEVRNAPPFKNPGRDYRLTISPLGIDNERKLASLRPDCLSDELRGTLFGDSA